MLASSFRLRQLATPALALALAVLLVLLLLLGAPTTTTCTAHLVDTSVRTFAINAARSINRRDAFNVSVVSPRTHAVCTFEYVTYVEPEKAAAAAAAEAAAAAAAAAAADTPVDLDAWIESWPSTCLDSPRNSWTYRVCLRNGSPKEVTQFVGTERYRLGTFKEYRNAAYYFEGGDSCPNEVKRSTTVHVQCHPDAKTAMVASVSEPKTCSYEMVVISAALCTDSRFPKATANVLPPHLIGRGADPLEYWRLRIDTVESAHGAPAPGRPMHVCSVHPLHPSTGAQQAPAPVSAEQGKEAAGAIEAASRLSSFSLTMQVVGKRKELVPARLFEQVVYGPHHRDVGEEGEDAVQETRGGVRAAVFDRELELVEVVGY